VLVAEDEAVIAIVDGASSVDLKRVEKLVGKRVRVAGREEVLRLIGFPAGGVPPVGHNCKVILDERVLENEKVYGGGGDEKHLLLIPPSEIIGGATVARIRKSTLLGFSKPKISSNSHAQKQSSDVRGGAKIHLASILSPILSPISAANSLNSLGCISLHGTPLPLLILSACRGQLRALL